jgi:nonsense-mediated mRNA decay protein 3
MFCVECGIEDEIYKDGVCLKCYIKNKKFSKGSDTLDLSVCVNCHGYKYKNTWTNDPLEEIMQRIVKNNIKISNELQKVNITIETNKTSQGLECIVHISGLIQEKEINEQHDLLIRLKKTVCEICSRQFGGYHEAIIQVRTEKRKFSKEELNEIKTTVQSLVESIQYKGNRTLFIADIAEEHGGLDFYISDKNAAFNISKILLDKYGGYIKQSSTNTGMKDGKQVYKMTYLVRIPSYKKGDFIQIEDTFYQIKKLHSNKVKIINLSTLEENSINPKKLEKARILDGQNFLIDMIVVSQTNGELQLMDEKTYDIHIVKKPKEIEYKTEKIQVIKIDNKLFLFPKLNIK